MKRLSILGFVSVLMAAAVACYADAPVPDAMEYLGYTGYETRQLTLRADFTYSAKWSDDVSRGGSATGTWELVGNEIRLTPKEARGKPMWGGPMCVLVMKEGKGFKSLVLKQEEAGESKHRKIPLYLQEKKLGNPPPKIPLPVVPAPDVGKKP